jgi:3-methyladenine DNA glycosylase AlkD
MNQIIRNVRDELKQTADDKTKNSFQRFFKEEVKCHGVKAAAVVKIAKKYFPRVQELGKGTAFDLCETLLESGYCEEAWVAANWAYWFREEYQPSDFKVFATWIEKYVDNWAECDTLCNHTVGSFIERYPHYLNNLKEWAASKNRWMRRAAVVSLIIPAKQGKFLEDIFALADILLCDNDDLVQKGYGWMLKEASRLHQAEVFEYVMMHKGTMPRTALRYAIEKMPPELKKMAMKKDS